jgi:hypothetical protein
MSRKEFVSLYDYGQGGLWVIIRAESAAQIREKYPQLQVFEGRPPMLDEPTLAAIRRVGVQDIDDPPAGWLTEFTPRS